MRQHQTQTEAPAELDAELNSRVPFVAIGDATDDRSHQRFLLRSVGLQHRSDNRRRRSGKNPISPAFSPQVSNGGSLERKWSADPDRGS
jgi:hypothetical protein